MSAVIECKPLREILKKNNQIKLTVGENYFDVISSTKDEGIKAFLDSSKLDLEGKDIILLGDSSNDRGLFMFPFEKTKQIIRVFLGSDDKLFNDISNSEGNSYYLKGQYTQGTQRVISALMK